MFLKKGEIVDIKDTSLLNIIQFLKDFWSKASEKVWLEIQFEKCFPEFREWLLEKEQESTKKSIANQK